MKKNKTKGSDTMKRTLIGILALCLLLLSATVLASPKSDFKEIWDKQTLQDGRYHIHLDTQFALLGKVENYSILDLTLDPFFARSQDTLTLLGQSQTATTYAVQNGDKLDLYIEETDTEQTAPAKWVHTALDLSADGQDAVTLDEMKVLLPKYNDVVRSVKFIDTDTVQGQLYAVTLDGRTFYEAFKKHCEAKLETAEPTEEYSLEMPDALANVLPAETSEAGEKRGKLDPKMMRTLLNEALKTWENTDSIVILARVREGEIKAVQTELAPQFNAAMHVAMTAVDLNQTDDGHQLGGLMEAFLQTSKMRLTIVRDGAAQHTAVPQDIIRTAEDKPLDQLTRSLKSEKTAPSAAQSE